MVAASLGPLAAGDPERYQALMVVMTLVTGLIYVIAGYARLGFIANFLSLPILTGFLNGIALIIIAGRLPKLFGYPVFDRAEAESQRKDAKIKDLQKRLFGKKNEKPGSAKSEKGSSATSKRKRGQQPGCPGHGRTPRPDLPVISEVRDLPEDEQQCPTYCLPFLPKPGLDEHTDFIEVEVKAHTRRIHRPAYVRNPGCCCPGTPAVITRPPPSRLIPRSPYPVSFWVEMLLSKYRYAQPTHRYLQDLSDRALPVSPGTVAGGLQAIAPVFEPIMEGLYQKQMTETLSSASSSIEA